MILKPSSVIPANEPGSRFRTTGVNLDSRTTGIAICSHSITRGQIGNLREDDILGLMVMLSVFIPLEILRSDSNRNGANMFNRRRDSNPVKMFYTSGINIVSQFLTGFMLTILILVPTSTQAASSSSVPIISNGINLNILPTPIKDAYNTLNKIQAINTSTTVKWDENNQASLWDKTKQTWHNVDTWTKETTGVSLTEILTVLGNLFVWFLEIIVQVLKWLLSLIKNG